MKFDAIIIGAGITGVTTAYYLHQKGYRVAVIDRQDKPAEETSFANGGQISVSHAEPWANPSAPLQVAKWLMNKNSPLYFSPKMDPHQWSWIAQWLYNCKRDVCDYNTSEITKLALESLNEFKLIRAKHKFKYDSLQKGIIHYYRDGKSYSDAIRAADIMQNNGLEIKVIDRQEMFKLEPSLFYHGDDIIGATYAPQDESGDAYKFTQQMYEFLDDRGVKFFFNTGVTEIKGSKYLTTGVKCVDITDPENYFGFDLDCANLVICMGSYSHQFVKANFGKSLSIYPAKGSSVTVPVINDKYAPKVSLTDDENKIVYSRLGDRLRIAGTAELAGWDATVNIDRCKVVMEHARQLFKDGCNWDEAEFWAGLRPATPSNLPYVEKLKDTENVYLNTGHGTLGWTLSCGSAKRIASIISG